MSIDYDHLNFVIWDRPDVPARLRGKIIRLEFVSVGLKVSVRGVDDLTYEEANFITDMLRPLIEEVARKNGCDAHVSKPLVVRSSEINKYIKKCEREFDERN